MADKQAIINDIRKTWGNMLNLRQVSEVFNCNRNAAPQHVKGLDCYQNGKEKKYLAIDIGRRIYERMEASE